MASSIRVRRCISSSTSSIIPMKVIVPMLESPRLNCAAKPHAAYFDAVFQRMGRPARASVLGVGDGLTSDIKGWLGCGLDRCRFNPRDLPADSRCPPTNTIPHLAEAFRIASSGEEEE
jgi:FMN phosphatase YigB (HAD superfamily)